VRKHFRVSPNGSWIRWSRRERETVSLYRVPYRIPFKEKNAFSECVGRLPTAEPDVHQSMQSIAELCLHNAGVISPIRHRSVVDPLSRRQEPKKSQKSRLGAKSSFLASRVWLQAPKVRVRGKQAIAQLLSGSRGREK